jgi:signal peptidase II
VLSAGRPAWMKAGAVVLFVLLLDFGSKAFVSSSLSLSERHELLPHLAILPIHNPGVRLSFIDGGIHLPFYVDVAALSAIGLMLLTHPPQRMLWLATGLLVGGALGNLLELLYHGYATDFVQVAEWRLIFNFADVALVSYALLMLALFAHGSLRAKKSQARDLPSTA